MPSPDFGPYYEAMYPRVWSYIRRLVSDSVATSDLAQETFVRLLQSGRDTLTEDQRTAYLFTIATNLVRDHWKLRAKWLRDDDVELAEMATRSNGAAATMAGLDIERALKTLPAMQRSMVWLAYAEGYDHATIARAVGVGEKSVKVILFRARKKLMEILRGSS